MNAISFLIKEHEKFRTTFADIKDGSHRDETRLKMFDELCDELVRHEKMEQKVWYPKIKKDQQLIKTVEHLLGEEKDAAEEIKKFKKVKDERTWEEEEPQFLKLKKAVEHHAEEEETKLFPQVEKFWDEAQLNEIGKEMREFKHEYEN